MADTVMTRERPILFSARMIRALLAGTKTQTRRAWRNSPPPGVPIGWVQGQTKQPYGWPGDRLWAREAWRADALFDGHAPRNIPVGAFVAYEAGRQEVPFPSAIGKLRPSMFMPRWASRILLEVTEVRVERLQEISEEDAKAEGVTQQPSGWWSAASGQSGNTARAGYGLLWNAINGPGSWDANPWVWAVSFKRVKP
jgi:hypothetical protein